MTKVYKKSRSIVDNEDGVHSIQRTELPASGTIVVVASGLGEEKLANLIELAIKDYITKENAQVIANGAKLSEFY
jgi:hypothetical protein